MKPVVQSFFRLPVWVQIWVALILSPINMGGLFFLAHPVGLGCAILGIGGMLPNLIIMAKQKGLSKAMAIPHLIPWTILIVWLLAVMTSPSPPEGALAIYVWALMVINTISLIFDYADTWAWWRGDRDIA